MKRIDPRTCTSLNFSALQLSLRHDHLGEIRPCLLKSLRNEIAHVKDIVRSDADLKTFVRRVEIAESEVTGPPQTMPFRQPAFPSCSYRSVFIWHGAFRDGD